ncbi:potassium channel family protein [Motiliproteus sediminis]|uniref:potassium channel family protein n=1 Tax=Motiliproteus sediminis TaxID=1468178 RepID=UPI001AEF52EE|nr:NAD-binding protein [Motiliproteus sediminis]
MNNIFFVLFRRLRAPLITLISVYAVSIFGFVLIPGVDDQGQPWQMSFFHAFYFVSFMGSTIGFGEVPYAFTDGQRMWTTVTIYATVIAWLYGIGKLLALFQDQAFIRLMNRVGFRRHVKRTEDDFYLVCGYGMTGSLVVKQLLRRGIRAVVVDIDQERIDALETDDLEFSTAGLCADASEPDVLTDAGLQRRNCLGVLALTNEDEVNLAIAIASKLLAPELTVICRSESDVTTANLASFGTDHIIDPFVTYAEYLALALHAPYRHLAYDWLTNPTHRALSSIKKQTQGAWVICGYGRFGRALHRSFADKPVSLTLIDVHPEPAGLDIPYVQGQGTEAETLDEGNIRTAVGLVAGTGNDANNLSIIMTALEMNPNLFTVARQNLHANRPVFQAANTDLVMEPAQIIAHNILSLIKTPMLSRFLGLMARQPEEWARGLVNRMSNVAGDDELDSWAFRIGAQETPAIQEAYDEGRSLTLSLLMTDQRDLEQRLPVICLMVTRRGESTLLPDSDWSLQPGDKVLFCGLAEGNREMLWAIDNRNVLDRLMGDRSSAGGTLWRWLRSLSTSR